MIFEREIKMKSHIISCSPPNSSSCLGDDKKTHSVVTDDIEKIVKRKKKGKGKIKPRQKKRNRKCRKRMAK